MIYAAAHKRNEHSVGVFAALFTAGLIVVLVAIGAPNSSFLESELGLWVLIFNWMLGSTFTLGLRRWVFDLPEKPGRHARSADPAIVAMENEAVARREARHIVESEPNVAVDLKIGRIDLPGRAFPDGGLIDVNNVPSWALEQATELPDYICRRITQNRPTLGGYQSAAEMSVTLHLPPNLLDTIEDRLVFLPLYQHVM